MTLDEPMEQRPEPLIEPGHYTTAPSAMEAVATGVLIAIPLTVIVVGVLWVMT